MMAGQPWIRGLYAILFILGAGAAHGKLELSAYYGENLPKLLEESYTPDQGRSQDESQRQFEPKKFDPIIGELHRVLSLVHVDRSGQPDKILDHCPDLSDCYTHKPLTYKEARKALFGYLHLKDDSRGFYVTDVYCDTDFTKQDFENTRVPGPWKIPDSNVVNAEHSWPQSRFNDSFSKRSQKSDLHILYPTDSRANSLRNNLKFGWVYKTYRSTCGTSKFGQGKGGQTYYEPPDQHKGNAARALFYFSVRYRLNISPDEEEALRQWHQLDPVDAFERFRNDEIFELQGTRNPFIDHPELVTKIIDF